MRILSRLSAGVFLILILISCPGISGTDPSGETENSGTSATVAGVVDIYFWGKWVRIDGGEETWYFSGDRIIADGMSFVPAAPAEETLSISGSTITKSTNNMLKVDPDDGTAFYLFRESGADARITSGVYDGDYGAVLSTRGFGSLGGIHVVLQNLENPSNTVQTDSDEYGNLIFDEVIPLDEYSLTIPVQDGVEEAVEIELIPSFDGEDVGNLTLTEAAQNFKVSYSISGAGEWGYYYAGNQYELTIKIKNIGSEDMLSADYMITEPEGLTLSDGGLYDYLYNIIGTIPADGGVKELTYAVTAADFTSDYKDFEIPVAITSYDGMNRWEDVITLRVFRETMTINVNNAAGTVRGVVISPDNRSFPFSTSGGTGSLELPVRSNGYILALSGTDLTAETGYAVRMNQTPSSNGSGVTDTEINEPNDDEVNGTPAFLDREYEGLLTIGDLDFFRIYNLKEDQSLDFQVPAGLYHEDVTVSIDNPVDGEIYYTLDGSTPDEESSVYSSSFIFDQSTVITARVYGGKISSDTIFSRSYILQPYTPLIFRSGDGAGDGYEMICATDDAVIRYTLDGSEPVEASPVYTGAPVGTSGAGTLPRAKAWNGNWDLSEEGNFSEFPEASFVTYGGKVDSMIRFDASGTADDDSSGETLFFRWDIDADGEWDSNWSNESGLERSFGTTGTHTNLLEVKDQYGLVSSVSREVIITEEYVPGDYGPAGGWIFYDNGDYSEGWRYLEAAPDYLDGTYFWGLTTVVVETEDYIGSGKSNTEKMSTTQISGTAGKTAKYGVLMYRLGGYADWFLPSVQELIALGEVSEAIGLTATDGLTSCAWMGNSASTAYEVGYSNGIWRSFTISKDATYAPVLPVRRF